VRVTTAFKRLLRLDGVNVTSVEFVTGAVVVTVALRRRKLHCPVCGHVTAAAYEIRRRDVSSWRHLDLGTWRLEIRAELRRLTCPVHGVRVEAVPFARHGSGFTADFEALVAWLATKTDKTTITRLVRIDWETVGRICARVVADELDPSRLDGLFEIGVDEVSWRKHHNYLTLVTNHRTARSSGAPKARTPRPSTGSSTNWAPSVPPRSRRSRWTWVRRSPRACGPTATLPRPSSASTRSTWSRR
jgi:transposase